jgi:hypothetical protein
LGVFEVASDIPDHRENSEGHRLPTAREAVTLVFPGELVWDSSTPTRLSKRRTHPECTRPQKTNTSSERERETKGAQDLEEIYIKGQSIGGLSEGMV